MIIFTIITLKKMDTLFTFPRKNPKYSNMNELKKTCTYLGINHDNKNKTDLITVLDGYYSKYNSELLPSRIEINFQGKSYYVNTHYYYKSFIKTYDDVYREVYKLTCYNGRCSIL